MVKRPHEGEPVPFQLEGGDLQQRRRGQVEPLPQHGVGVGTRAFAPCGRAAAVRPVHGERNRHPLLGPGAEAVGATLHPRAQHLVPLGQQIERGAQRVGVQLLLVLVALLDQSRLRYAVAEERRHGEPPLRGQQRRREDAGNAPGGRGPLGRSAVQMAGESSHRGVREHVHRLDGQPGPGALVTHPEGGDGVPAAAEEVVVRTELRQAQHLAPDRQEPPPGGGQGRGPRTAVARVGEIAHHARARPPVGLAVGGARQGVDDEHPRGDHGGGQLLGERGTQVGPGDRRPGDDGGGQFMAALCVVQHHGDRLGDARVCMQRPFHLGQFDAHAAHLHLVVATPGEHQVPFRGVPDEVSGAVPAASLAGDEPFAGQCRIVEVAPGDADATEEEFAVGLRRARVPVRVEDQGPQPRQRTADGRGAAGDGACHLVRGGVDGHLGGPVDVEQPMPLLPGPPLVDPCGLGPRPPAVRP